MRVLIIDDEEYVSLALRETLAREGCETGTASNGRSGIERLKERAFDAVITDLKMPGFSGLDVLAWIRDHQPDVDVIVLTGNGEVHTVVEAIKAGAWDFLIKDIPFDTTQVAAALNKLRVVRSLRRENVALRFTSAGRQADLIVHGTSPAWKRLMDLVEKVASSNAPALIQGETGSGKELIARTLHDRSPRRDSPFLAVNCGTVRGDLLESELLGHEKGAFTGATGAKEGLIAAAEDGTLFLDEIAEMSGAMQVSLLRVLDRHEYRAVGGTRTLAANVRFLAATHRDLQELVLAGKFRDDLLYRINTITLRIPPLRE